MALGPVRTVSSVPTAANFASGDGTPIVVNDTPGSETAYILNASGSVAALGGSAGAAAFTQVIATSQSTVRASVTTSLRVSASTNITINLNATANAITLSAASGAGEAFPVGAVFISTTTTNPNTLLGYGTWAFLGEGQVLIGMATGIAAFNTVRATGGALSVASSGTVSTPTFTGDNYTPSGTNAASLTRDAVAGTNAISLTRDAVAGTNATSLTRDAVAGTNAVSLFREASAGTLAPSAVTGSVSVEWPVGVPTFAGTTASASVSVNWPTGRPTFAGTAHQHGLPFSHTVSGVYFMPVATWGSGTSATQDVKLTVIGATGTNLVAGVSARNVMLSQTATAAGTISWPASVPQARVTGLVPQGIISWPATAPSAVAKTLTAAAQIFTGVTGSVSGQIFTGLTASVSGQVFTGLTASVSGQVFTGTTASVSAQVFTGVAKAPTGTVSKPTYLGDATSVVQPFFVVCMWERTA